MMKYYEIHVTYGNNDGDGYTIPIAIENGNEDEVVQKAVNDCLFEEPEDVENIDYIEELEEDEYNDMYK